VLFYQDKITTNNDMALISAFQEIPKGALVGLLDTIRTRVLNMALEMKDELGGRVNNLSQLSSDDDERVEHTVVTNIYGGTNVIASGNAIINANINQTSISQGDWGHLAQVLRGSGLQTSSLDELKSAIQEDGTGSIGGKIMAWIKNAAPAVLAGGVKIGASAAESFLVALLKQYLGLPS